MYVLTSSGKKAVPFSELISLHGKGVLSYICYTHPPRNKQSQMKNFSEFRKYSFKAVGKEWDVLWLV
jgi:hypothetical protein